MDPAEWEGESCALRREAGLEPHQAVTGVAFAERHPNTAAVHLVRLHEPPWARRAENEDGLDVITVHVGHSDAAMHLRAACEVVEGAWSRRRLPVLSDDIKREVVAVGARIILPRYAMRRAVALFGHRDLAAIGGPFGASMSMAGLRVAEIYERPIALVSAVHTQRAVRVGDLPSRAELAAIVRRGGTRTWEVLELTDRDDRGWAVWPRDWW